MLKREDAATLFDVCERALRVLTEAEDLIFRLQKEEGGKAWIDAYVDINTDILRKLRAPLVIQYPDLDTNVPEGPPDTLLDQEEQDAVDRLTPEQLRAIDNALLAECATPWKKVARVIGAAMKRVPGGFPAAPSGYYAQRLILMADAGHLESRGNLEYMRFSEVRLPEAGAGESLAGVP